MSDVPLAGYTIGIPAARAGEQVGAALERRGAKVSYGASARIAAPADDPAPLHRLVEQAAGGQLDALVFTSAPDAASFVDAAQMLDSEHTVLATLRTEVVAACLDALTAAPLVAAGVPVVRPRRGRLDALVDELVQQVPRLRGRTARAAGHDLDVRGQAVVVDGAFVALPATGAALLRELARNPGYVVPRATLLRLLPGDGVDGHAVDVAVGRLRAALGDPAIVQTVVKRGYRLCVDAQPP